MAFLFHAGPPTGAAFIYQQTSGDQLEPWPLYGGPTGPYDLIMSEDVLAGDYIYVVYSCRQGNGAPTISDDAGNDWIAIYTADGYGAWYCIAKAASAGNEIHFGNRSYDQSARLVEVTNFTSPPSLSLASGTGLTAMIAADELTSSAPLNASTGWALAMVEFDGANGSSNFFLLLMVCGAGDAGGNSFRTLPSLWEDAFASGEANANGAAYILEYEAVYAVTVGDVVTDICERAGLDSSQIDVSELTAENLSPTNMVLGYLVDRPTPAANILKTLMTAYFFDAVETNGTMKFVPRGLAAALTIPEADLGLEADKGKLEEQIAQEQDLPYQFTTTYNDPTLDYQQNKQMKRRSSRIVNSTQQASAAIPMTMTPDWALQQATKSLYLAWLERSSYKINLWRASYLLLDPTDVIAFTYESLTFQMRIAQSSVGANFSAALDGLSEYAEAFLSDATGAAAIGPAPARPQLQLLGPTFLFLFDIPLLSDTDSNPDNTGFYFGLSSALPAWVGALLFNSTDDVNFFVEGSSSQAVTFGAAVNALGAPARSPWIWDNTNTLTVNLSRGMFAGDTPLNVLNGSNYVLVGRELIQFTTAVQNADGSWTLSGLLRGRRGTEWACGTHAAGDLVAMPFTGMQRVQLPLAAINQERWYKGVTNGQDPSTVTSQEFTIAGNDLKPYAPCSIAGARDMSGNLTATWIRRTRVGWSNLAQDPVPLSEDNEAYSVDILNGSAVVRTIVSTSPAISYSAAEQTADFGSAQDSISMKVYQLSAQVGRGFAAAASV